MSADNVLARAKTALKRRFDELAGRRGSPLSDDGHEWETKFRAVHSSAALSPR